MQVETFLQICGEDFNFCSGQPVGECKDPDKCKIVQKGGTE